MCMTSFLNLNFNLKWSMASLHALDHDDLASRHCTHTQGSIATRLGPPVFRGVISGESPGYLRAGAGLGSSCECRWPDPPEPGEAAPRPRRARVLGTSPDDIDRAEDRHKFSSLLDDLGVDQPPWRELQSVKDAQARRGVRRLRIAPKQKKRPPFRSWRRSQGDASRHAKPPQAFAAEVQSLRPSFVLSGAAMKVATSDSELAAFLGDAADVSPDHPVVVSKFIRNAKEIEFDAVCRDGAVPASFHFIQTTRGRHTTPGVVFEWIRTAPGVGSGPDVGKRRIHHPRARDDRPAARRHDHELRHFGARRERGRAVAMPRSCCRPRSSTCRPRSRSATRRPVKLRRRHRNRVRRRWRAAAKIAEALNISGPVNIQFMARDNDVEVIECNLRASRSFPFISKTMNCNFISLATRVMLGQNARPFQITTMDIDYVCVKAAMFSFSRLRERVDVCDHMVKAASRWPRRARWPAWAPTSMRPTSTRWKGAASRSPPKTS